MNNKEWLSQLSNLTALSYYQEHKVFGDKSGALIGIRDGYIVAIGLGKVESRHSAVKMLLRYAKTPDPQRVKQALDPAKGKLKQITTDATTATLVRTYSFGKPDAATIADPLPGLLAAMKTSALAIDGKCEECGRDLPQVVHALWRGCRAARQHRLGRGRLLTTPHLPMGRYSHRAIAQRKIGFQILVVDRSRIQFLLQLHLATRTVPRT